jgi:hypothetical protein
MIFKILVRTTNKAPHFTVTKINKLIMRFKEIISVYTNASGMRHAPAALYPRERTPVPIG